MLWFSWFYTSVFGITLHVPDNWPSAAIVVLAPRVKVADNYFHGDGDVSYVLYLTLCLPLESQKAEITIQKVVCPCYLLPDSRHTNGYWSGNGDGRRM